MEENKFNDFFSNILLYNLMLSILLGIIVLLFNFSMVGILFVVLPIVLKIALWFSRNKIVNIEDTSEKVSLAISLFFITLYFAIDAIIYSNFLPASIVLIIPIFLVALKKDFGIIKLETAITVLFMILTLILSLFITPFKSGILTNLLFFMIGLIQLLFIIKRFTEETLSISAKSEFFMDKSRRDDMTGLYNNGAFYDAVGEMAQLMAPFCIIILNIDNFKKVKDTFGQPFGDYVLKTVVKTIKKTCRNQDTAFRYGNEDIAVIFPRTSNDEAFKIAEKIRKSFSETAYNHNTDWARTKRPITISIGLIESNQRGAMPQELIEKCDKALFYSKQHGKNQTTIYQEHILEWEDKFDDFRRKYRDFER